MIMLCFSIISCSDEDQYAKPTTTYNSGINSGTSDSSSNSSTSSSQNSYKIVATHNTEEKAFSRAYKMAQKTCKKIYKRKSYNVTDSKSEYTGMTSETTKKIASSVSNVAAILVPQLSRVGNPLSTKEDYKVTLQISCL